jgi:hypothetical protein
LTDGKTIRATGQVEFVTRDKIPIYRVQFTENGVDMEDTFDLLRTTNESLNSIASRLGFCDAFHFSRVFKTETGNSPSAYRKLAQSPTPFDLVPASPHGDR